MGVHPTKDFSAFHAMSTEELKMFLWGYLNTPESESNDSDMDTVLHVMEVIAAREQKEDANSTPNVNDAWRDFEDNYLNNDVKAKSVRLSTDHQDVRAKNMHTFPIQRPSSRWHSMSVFSRVACIVLAVVLTFFAGTGIASAAGFDVWQAIATWTDDTFGFHEKSGILEITDTDSDAAFSSLQNALDSYEITTALAPKWIPKDYSLTNVIANDVSGSVMIFATYSSSDSSIYVSITSMGLPSHSTVEKDPNDAIKYTVSGIDHYILTNNGESLVTWTTENYECLLSGNGLSLKQLQAIIDSIYWRS